MKEHVARWRRFRRMKRELADFGPHELNELGIARTDIDRFAYDAVYGDPLGTNGVNR